MYMIRLTNFPVVVLVVSFLLLFLAGSIGTSFRKKKHLSDDAVGADAGLVLGATLTHTWAHHRIHLFDGYQPI